MWFDYCASNLYAMPDHQTETTNQFIKIGLYILGVCFGLAAKLADMHKKKPITLSTAITELCIAAASAYGMWAYFHYVLHKDDMAIVFSVIMGRYGDAMILNLYRFAVGFIADKKNKIQ